MKKPEKKNILVSLPLPLLKRLDSSAKSQARSRTNMVCQLLEQSLKPTRAASKDGGVSA